ncbi:MAG TPA: nucleoside recognition domain-containing protein [Vicinamibacterales bacterium]|nr:nucleoside recognition domain-containing protein [Vicinamibacterales bacterium]
MNIVWLLLIGAAVITAVFKGTMAEVSNSVFSSATTAIELAIGLVGGMTLFLGLMRVAQDSGLVQVLARALRPVFRFLFPDVPKDHPALGAIAMNFGANMLGLGDAATPFGLKAMQDLQTLNPDKESATDAMAMFVTLHSSSLQLIPVMVISLRAAAGSKNPSEIIVATIFATAASMAVAIATSKLFARWYARRWQGGAA